MMLKKNRFSIIELLVVIAIIAVLAGLVMASMTAVAERRDKAATQALIDQISIGLSKYYDDNGAYPTATYQAVTQTMLNGYVTISDEFLSGDVVMDKWGNPLKYIPSTIYSSSANVASSGGRYYNFDTFQLRSFGKDNADDSGGPDDIQNFRK